MLNIRILVVDDHGTLRKRIADYLRAQEGVEEVAEAANGVEALKCLRDSRFDVMITDLVMPLMDGYMLLEELPRQIDPAPKTIVMSALSRDDFVTRAIDLGAVFYMVKPFEPEHLLSHIRDIQEERSVLPQAQAPVRPHVQSLDERLGSLFLTIGRGVVYDPDNNATEEKLRIVDALLGSMQAMYEQETAGEAPAARPDAC